MTMTKIKLCLILSFFSIMAMAQEKKSFTLNDLLPGGNTFYGLQPENMFTTWWGDQCIETSLDECRVISAKNGKKTVLFSLDQLNGWLGGEEKPVVRSCYNLEFPYAEQPYVLVKTPSKWYLADFRKGKT